MNRESRAIFVERHVRPFSQAAFSALLRFDPCNFHLPGECSASPCWPGRNLRKGSRQDRNASYIGLGFGRFWHGPSLIGGQHHSVARVEQQPWPPDRLVYRWERCKSGRFGFSVSSSAKVAERSAPGCRIHCSCLHDPRLRQRNKARSRYSQRIVQRSRHWHRWQRVNRVSGQHQCLHHN